MYRIRKDAVGLTMAIAMSVALCGGAQAQTMPAGSALPRLVRFSGTAKDTGGNPVTGVTGITFALYAEQTGGAPLWSETQNVQAGAGGHYTLLGAAKSEGLPADLFTAEQAHWVGVSVEGQAEPVGNDTSRDSGTLNLLFGSRKSTPAETGLSIASNGRIAFAAGQIFPGTGTITGVTAGADLTGGGATGNVTLNLDTTKVPQLATANTFTGNQTVNGTVTATSFSGSGAGVTNVNANQLGGLGTSAYAQLAASNTFSGQQIMTGTKSLGVLQVTNALTSGEGPAIVGTTKATAPTRSKAS